MQHSNVVISHQTFCNARASRLRRRLVIDIRAFCASLECFRSEIAEMAELLERQQDWLRELSANCVSTMEFCRHCQLIAEGGGDVGEMERERDKLLLRYRTRSVTSRVESVEALGRIAGYLHQSCVKGADDVLPQH